jgi:hypothetical protein
MNKNKSLFLSDCIHLNNKILDSFDYLGIAIKHKYTEENHLFKIPTLEENKIIIEAHIYNNLTLLDCFLDFMLYIFSKTDCIILTLQKKEQKDTQKTLHNLQESTQELLAVLDNKELTHEHLYLEMFQLREILNLLLSKIEVLQTIPNLMPEQIKIDLKDPVSDLQLGRRQVLSGLQNLSQLEKKMIDSDKN